MNLKVVGAFNMITPRARVYKRRPPAGVELPIHRYTDLESRNRRLTSSLLSCPCTRLYLIERRPVFMKMSDNCFRFAGSLCGIS